MTKVNPTPNALSAPRAYLILRSMNNMRLFLIVSLLTLGGCSTLESIGTDISARYDALSEKFHNPVDPVKEAKKQLPLYDGTCPGVTVRPDLRHLVEFRDESKPSADTIVSEITMMSVENVCRVEKDTLVMQIDFHLAAKTGPKARVKPTDIPSFAYPYFVAVTDSQGTILSKEVFAASVAYGRKQNELTQVESIFQNMPYPDHTIGRTYNVIVGFQLSPAQLDYNNRIGINAAATP